MSASNPPAGGVRPGWSALPGSVRSALEGWLGGPVATAHSQAGGFSPGIAARIRTADGARYFVKGAGPVPNRDAPGIHRREARVQAAMPDGVAVPRMLWSYDDDETGWVLLAFQDIEGRASTYAVAPRRAGQGGGRPGEARGHADPIAASRLPCRKREECVSAVYQRLAPACRRAAVRQGPPRSVVPAKHGQACRARVAGP